MRGRGLDDKGSDDIMNRKGVTLIELVVVMVIIAIAAVFFVPNIGAWLPNYRLRSTARDIVSTMRTAQMKAVSSNVEYRVYFHFDAGDGKYRYWIERGNLSSGSTNWVGTTDPHNAAREGGITEFPSGVTNSFAGFIEFNPNSTSSSGTIRLQNSRGMIRVLTITPSTGRVTIATP
jgi:prepilin-type N-terminal cleavage/methylation domain-containing protein